MSWTEVDLAGVSSEMERIPEGSYVWALLPGTKFSKFDKDKIELGAKIVDGEYNGRVIYFSYGSPEKAPSMVQALKRLEEALVKDGAPAIAEGQDKIEYFNDAEVVGKRFIAPVKHRSFVKNGDTEPTVKEDISVFKLKAVA
jgi:hypothetical protein